MFTLPGYHIQKKYFESGHSLIFRAERDSDQLPVVLKVLKNEYPTLEELARFRQEYEILKGLESERIIQVYALESFQNTPVIVLEDFGGESLLSLLPGLNLTIDAFLTLAIELAKALGEIQQHHIIHKDINPSNIIYNQSTGQLKLIDFGISTVLTRENPILRNPNVLEGTLAYISPEQTGRMNRAIDYRTDFYSLGITLYEILTGHLPFVSDDAMELVHWHLAKQPLPPEAVRPDIPVMVSRLILKLMAKTAEERYQSAHGLLLDLQQCQELVRSGQTNVVFQPGQEDFSDRFQIPQKLYGRQAEIEQLLAAFDRVSQGHREMMLVVGYSGIGKSALVQEIYKPITERRGYFVAGKFDQLQRNIPYTALIQACDSLIHQLLTEPEEKIASWRKNLRLALGANGQVIAEVLPAIELIVGPQPPVEVLPPFESQNRFHRVFRQFIKVFAQTEHPLVMFVDDLQWADAASLKLIHWLVTQPRPSYLFVIGAYRDNEVHLTHPLILALDEILRSDVALTQVRLSRLELPHILQLVADTLSCLPSDARPLAELVLAKTQGNPFFMNEFLKSLAADGLIWFDFPTGRWLWDVAQIQECNITDNVVELMAGKVQKLDSPTQELLKLAACVGNHFDIHTLAIVSGKTPHTTIRTLRTAVSEGLVTPLGDTYKLLELDLPDRQQGLRAEYKFLHDRIQQAVYSLISGTDQQNVHLLIGRQLLEQTPESRREQVIFDIVNHLNQATSHLSRPADLRQLAELNLAAARKAKASAAFELMYTYLQHGLKLLPGNRWESVYHLTLDFYIEIAEAAFLNTDFASFDRYARTALEQAHSLLDVLKIYEVQIQACMAQNQQLKAIETAVGILNQLGVSLPEKPTKKDFRRELAHTRALLAGKSIQDLLDWPLMTDPKKQAALRILAGITSAAYQALPALFPLVTFQQVNLSVDYGTAPLSAYAYGLYGVVLCGLAQDIETGYQFGQLGLRLLEKFGSKELAAKTVFSVNVTVRNWKEHLKETISSFQEAYQNGLETGDLEYAALCAFGHCYHAYHIGAELTALEQVMAAYREAPGHLLHLIQLYRQVVLNLIGKNNHPCQLIGVSYDETVTVAFHEQANNRTALARYWMNKAMLGYWFDEFETAYPAIRRAESLLDGIVGTYDSSLFYFYDSLIALAGWYETAASEQGSLLKRVAANQRKLKGWARHAPQSYLHKHALVQAEYYRVLAQPHQAGMWYETAIDLAKKHNFPHEEALACELTARFYLGQRRMNIAFGYLMDARYGYQRWGAVAKVKHLDEQYSPLMARKIETRNTSTTFIALPVFSTTSTGSASAGVLDLTSVVKASQALSSEIVLEKLLSKLIRILIENAGAQKGVLLFPQGGELIIEAECEAGKPARNVLQSLPARTSRDLPQTVVNYVARACETVLLENAPIDRRFGHDTYIQRNQVRSILCQPVLHQGKLTAVLYLENQTSIGAFTPQRVEMLNLLSAQAAVSLENALLYANLERKVTERTAELSILNIELGERNRQLEETRVEAEKQRERAEDASLAKSRFLASMSHELRTPLNAILGFTQLLARKTKPNDEAYEHLSTILASGEHLLGLINDVLSISKIEAGQMFLNEGDFDLHLLLQSVENMFRLRAEAKGLEFHFDLMSEVPHLVTGDEGKLRQVLLNLLSNAFKFTESGRIVVRTAWADQRAMFEVEDTGVGIAPEEMSRLFEAFVQTQAGLKTQEGTGLGLVISRNFARLMGGDITVISQVGKGTTFRVEISLPRMNTAIIRSTPDLGRVVRVASGQRVFKMLVVDDSWENRTVLSQLLESVGFEVVTARNGREAITCWQIVHPDVVWLELDMPELNGYETARAIRRLEQASVVNRHPSLEPPNRDQTILVALSASVFEQDREAILNAGFQEFIAKPYREAVIFGAMAQYLGVMYEYESPEITAERDSKSRESTKLIDWANHLMALPSALVSQLRETLVVGDTVAALQLTEDIRQMNPLLADEVERMVRSYKFDELLDA